MKTRIFTIIFLAFLLKGQSQEHFFQVGLKTGVGISAIYGGKDFKNNLNPNKISHSLINGLSMIYQPVSILTVQADVLYSSRKYGRDYNVALTDSTSQDFSSSNSYNYLSISLLPGIKTKGKTSFIFNGGPTLNLLTSKSSFIKSNEHTYHTNFEKVKIGSKNTFDLGLTLEVGVQHKIFSFLDFKAGIRNETSLFNDVPNANYDPLKFNTTNFYVGLLYVFDIKKSVEKITKKEE